jgi:hypothetical protein
MAILVFVSEREDIGKIAGRDLIPPIFCSGLELSALTDSVCVKRYELCCRAKEWITPL